MQISEAGAPAGPGAGGAPSVTTTTTTTTNSSNSTTPGGGATTEPCRFPKLEECAHFHYERVHLPKLAVQLQTNVDQSLHSQHANDDDDTEWYMIQVTSGDQCWLLQRNFDNFKMLDAQLHQCIYDRKIFQLPDLSSQSPNDENIEEVLRAYLDRFSDIANSSINCGPVLNWLQMDNKGHRLLVPSEESRSINTPAVAAAYGVRRYVSQAIDELNLDVGDMISVIDMASPGESMWWRGKRGFQVGFFPQHCVQVIGDKVPRNMPLPPPVVGSLALSPIKPVLRKHGKIITFFRSFILNRPSRRRLKQSGILKERVFGCDLGEHLLNSGHDIPMVLKCCAEFIESHGIVDGIYRLSGVTSNIQKLRNAFDEDRIPNLYTDDILQDIHSVASLLKMYFRELPNPLCTYQLYQSFVNAVQGCNSSIRNSDSDHDRLLKMREAVQKLPPPHYRTLEYLMRHLARVAKHGASTGMTTRNVAIVWAPNLLRCAELEVGGVAALQGVGVQAVVTEFLICYAHLIFCDRLPNMDLPTILSSSGEHRLIDPSSGLSPKRSAANSNSCRPKSLAISTPTKLITLEEARSKHLLLSVSQNKNSEDCCGYIEVGGGPKNLPKKYHTVIELPGGGGARKRQHAKRSPLGWRSLFSKSRNSSQGNLSKSRKASTPGIIISDKSVTECDLSDIRRKLRSVKSAESLTSGHSEPASNEIDVLGPLYSLNKPPGHNRSVSHDSYFDTLQTSQNNSEGSLLDLSEIQLNFELEESEMRIFSEDESLVSSPRIQRGDGHHGGGATATGHNNYGQQQQQQNSRRVLTRARPEEFGSAANSGNPSPKKQPRVVPSMTSPPPSDSATSRKRTRLEDQLGDIQFIDCGTPDNNIMVCDSNNSSGTTTTTALVHQVPASAENHRHQQNSNENITVVASERSPDSYYQPKNKSPRNSHHLDAAADDNKCQQPTAVARHLKRQSLNLEQHNRDVAGTTRNVNNTTAVTIPKSYTTEMDLGNRAFLGAASVLATPTPQSPVYRQLGDEESSTANTTPDSPLADITYQHLNNNCGGGGSKRTSSSNNYENILTTISITYKSPPRSVDASPVKRSPPTSLGNCCYDVNNSGSSSYGYENVLVNVETAMVPTSAASLPDQGAAQPIIFQDNEFLNDTMTSVDRPKSTNALEDRESSTTLSNHSNNEEDQEQQQTLRPNLSSDAICDTSEQISMVSLTDQRSLSSNHSSRSNVQYTASSISSGGVTAGGYRMIENAEQLSPTDLSLSEVVQSSTENLSTSHTSMSFPLSVSRNSTPNVSPTQIYDNCLTSTGEGLISEGGTRNTSEASLIEEAAASSSSRNNIDLIEFSPTEPENNPSPSRIMGSLNDKRKSSETEPCDDDSAIYQQVKVLRRSVHEVNALLDIEKEREKEENLKDFPSKDAVDHPSVRLQQSSVQCAQFIEGNSEPQIEELDCTRKTEKDAKIGTKVPEEIRDFQENDSNVVQNLNFDSLEAENVHVYENMNGEELRRDHDCNVYENVEISNNSFQENDQIRDKTSDSSDVMKDSRVLSEAEANRNFSSEVDRKTSQDGVEKQEDLSADVVVRNKVCVKDLTNRFEDRSSNNNSQENNGTNVSSIVGASLLPTHVTAASAGDTTITTSNTSSVSATKDSSSIIKNSDSSDRRRTGENDSSSSVSTSNLLSTNDDNDGSSSSNTDVGISTTIMTSDKPKKLFYEKDSLPPCLRARNLKHQMKTRSLDEEEFKKEFSGVGASESDISCARSGSYCKKKSGGGDLLTFSTNSMDLQGRRKSMEEVGGAGMGYKTNSLPKTLNQPKLLPTDGDKVSSMIHLAHSTENLSAAEEEQKKRERIEKYKEERRKFLQDKYRSESFKEDKDVLISKLKLFSAKQPKEESGGGNSATVSSPPQSSAQESAVEENLKKEEMVITKGAEIEQQTPQIKLLEAERTRTRRRSSSTKSDDSVEATVLPVATKHSPEILGKNGDFSTTIVTSSANIPSNNKVPSGSSKLPAGGPGLIMMTESLKSRAAMFERATTVNQRTVSSIPSFIHTAEQPKKSPVCKKNPNAANNSSNTGALLSVGQGQKSDPDDADVEILRRKKEDCTGGGTTAPPGWSHLKNNNVSISSSSNEKRRHTYESGRRERELLADQSREIIADVTGATNNSRRISLDTNKSPRREKSSPTYCIKDMKAIFESKSKQ